MNKTHNMTPSYASSHALIIGVDHYQKVSPLAYAVNDAKAIYETLLERYMFPKKNIALLLDKRATRAAIMERFMSYVESTQPDDRVVVFFAGHGHTVPSSRGQVGFLVPVDGDPRRLASLVRWDELTKGSDLIPAKHILFLMDACYGGLAITRALRPGSMRFLRDMLVRPARQVLTAGKADEVVADLGGPRPDHSIFTGYLLEALEGQANNPEGILTANGVMAYVYQKVGQDRDSGQTPHFGYFDGDGDLVFAPSDVSTIAPSDEQRDQDVLVSIPAVIQDASGAGLSPSIAKTKELLSDPRYRIELHDQLAQEVRQVLSLTAEDHFALQAAWSQEEFVERVTRYQQILYQLMQMQALVAFWGGKEHHSALILPLKRLSDRNKVAGGLKAWVGLRWYPSLLLLYAGGVAAVANGRYDNLSTILQTLIADPEESRHGDARVAFGVPNALREVQDVFKMLPGHERHFTPRSEHLHKVLQPILDDLLFLGDDYENCFDRFEIFLALECADVTLTRYDRVWGPLGRFAWKFQRGGIGSPFQRVVEEAQRDGASWAPLEAGLFGGSAERLSRIVTDYSEGLRNQHWL